MGRQSNTIVKVLSNSSTDKPMSDNLKVEDIEEDEAELSKCLFISDGA